MSKILSTILILGLFFCSTQKAYAQNYSSHRFLIVFEQGTTAAEIQQAKDELNCIELWVSPISEVRLWEVIEFPFTYVPTGLPISNINEETTAARGRAKVQEAGLDYEGEEITNINDQPIPLYSGPDTNLDCYGQLSTNVETDDQSVDIGVFDTGFRYPVFWEYTGYYFELEDFVQYDYIENDPVAEDFHGHGTHVSSVIAHLTNKDANEKNYAEPDVSFNMCKTFDAQGYGHIAEIIYSFEEAVLAGMNIANFSWSFRAPRDEALLSPLKYSIETVLLDYEVLIVAAAGNNGENIDDPNTIPNWPAAYSFNKMITVGTYDCTSDVASFSNFGHNSIDIVAPGYKIPGLVMDGLVHKTGTSQSTSIVSGVAGMLATHQIEFDALEIKCAIINGAMNSSNLNLKVVSKGYLDAFRALNILGNCNLGNRGTANIEEKQSIFPNPANDLINLEVIVADETNTSVNIYNSLGSIVQTTQISLQKGLNNVAIPLSFGHSGMYILEIKDVSNFKNQSFIKL